MMRKSLLWMILVLFALPLLAQPPDLQADLDAMVAAERAFSKLSVDKGFKESFLAYIADDGIMFRPTPMKSKELLASRPNPPIHLVWWPSHAEIARSGEMGWTTGPWERRTEGSDEVLYGHFVTVWKEQPDGKWRWVIDTGISHAKPTGPAGSPPPVPKEKNAGPMPKVPKLDTAAETKALLAADRELGQATAQGTSAAYLARLTDDARLMRDGSFPFVGKEAVRAALEKVPAAMTSEPLGGDVSAAADLGYTYGNAEWKEGDQPVKVGYLRIWEKRGTDWKLRVDWIHEAPPPPTPAKPGS
jgi:ketosteroid isomerase-like protein